MRAENWRYGMKKIISCLCSVLLIFGITVVSVIDTEASTELPIIDGSYLTYDSESIGYITSITRGVDLLNGYSKIVRMGPEVIYAGGTTMAMHDVAEVRIAIMVERTVDLDEGSWEFVDGWSVTRKNTDRATTSERLDVDGDYYYRVRGIHSANSESGQSYTNGIYVEKKSGILSTTN